MCTINACCFEFQQLVSSKLETTILTYTYACILYMTSMYHVCTAVLYTEFITASALGGQVFIYYISKQSLWFLFLMLNSIQLQFSTFSAFRG